MTKRTGSADLPLHGGRVPAWLGSRMARLGRIITEAKKIPGVRADPTGRPVVTTTSSPAARAIPTLSLPTSS